MTAQVGDSYYYKDKRYQIVAISVPMNFSPSDYGLTPQFSSTACYNGYWCEYSITDDEILLKNLYINDKEQKYPAINGANVEKKKGKNNFMGHHLYRDINLPIKFSGKIILGDGFMRDYSLRMGYQRGWAYKILKEFVFEEGIVLDIIDHSELAKQMREKIKDDPKKFYNKLRGDVSSFVEDSFSLDMERKCWWIK